MSSLPQPMRAENMMCYIGHEGTYTPAHREMCASLGHNIMVERSDVVGEDGKQEHPGSSIWFMTESKDRHTVSEYWLSTLGHDIEVENHFAQIMAWKQAPFTTYVVEQRAGDLILIPPMAPHQVWNRGTRTMKAAWNRTTVETLEMAMKEALPNARMVCRDEQYKNKAIIYFTLQKYSSLLARARDQQQTAPTPQEATALRTSPRIRQLQKDFKRLFHLFKDILLSEMFAPENPHERNIQFFPYESNITCAYCRCNIFNRFLTCPTCDDALGTTEPEPYDVCLDCFAMGRSCGCISKLKWCEQFKWKELTQKYESWRRQYLELEGGMRSDSPQLIVEERLRLNKKTLAQVCQEQLKRRPWNDIHKKTLVEDEESDENEEIAIKDDGTVKKPKKRRSEAWLKNHHACHVCGHRHEKWKMAECKCGRWYCYGTLFRGYDLMPQAVMEDPTWECPHCKGICFAGNCRKDPRQNPYEPKGTLLGHDTRKVADVRSVESLVDFSVSNLNWLKESVHAPAHNARLRKHQEEASRAKLDDTTLNDDYATDDEVSLVPRDDQGNGIEYSPDTAAIDPQLRAGPGTQFRSANADSALIDPLLREDHTDSARYASPRGPHTANGDALPTFAAMLNGARPEGNNSPLLNGQHPGYKPATQSGFIAPSAVMWQQSQEADNQDCGFSYADPEQTELSGSKKSKKRRAQSGDALDGIIRAPAKKARHADERNSITEKSLSGANKQYRKQQERKALEEARKAGRFIQVNAKLKGKQKLVKLRIGNREAFARIRADDLAKRRHVQLGAEDGASDGEIAADTILLRSDIAPSKPHPLPRSQNAAKGEPAKPSKQVRIRVERDDDFGRGQRRHRPSVVHTANKKKAQLEYEEVELLSESDAENEDGDGALETTNAGDKRRRISSWQKKHHDEEDEELPEELPDNWKDGRAGRRRENHPRSSTIRPPAGKSVPQIRPSILKNTTTSDPEDEDDDEEHDNQAEREAERSRQRATASAAAALLLEEENRRAKLDAAKLIESEDSEDTSFNDADVDAATNADADVAEIDFIKGVASAGTSKADPNTTVAASEKKAGAPPSASIFSRQGPGGKKIKIISGAGRRLTTGGIAAGSSKSTPVAKGAQSSPLRTGSTVTPKRGRGRPSKSLGSVRSGNDRIVVEARVSDGGQTSGSDDGDDIIFARPKGTVKV